MVYTARLQWPVWCHLAVLYYIFIVPGDAAVTVTPTPATTNQTVDKVTDKPNDQTQAQSHAADNITTQKAVTTTVNDNGGTRVTPVTPAKGDDTVEKIQTSTSVLKTTTDHPVNPNSSALVTTNQPNSDAEYNKPNNSTTSVKVTDATAQTDSDSHQTKENKSVTIPKSTVEPSKVTESLSVQTAISATIKPESDINSPENTQAPFSSAGGPGLSTVSLDVDWINIFIHIHHFEGQYTYNGVQYLFDFVVRYLHPDSFKTLVAMFYDQDGAILEMNGTSIDGDRIVFKTAKIYTSGWRFPAGTILTFNGTLETIQHSTLYTGEITETNNSSFTKFHMNKGLGRIETGEDSGTRTAIIIIIPTSVAFLGIIGTVALLCWASKKGYLRGRHKSYQLFQDTPIKYETEAETIHI